MVTNAYRILHNTVLLSVWNSSKGTSQVLKPYSHVTLLFATVHTSYNLNMTHIHMQRPSEIYAHDFVIYTQLHILDTIYELPSFIGLLAYSPTVYTSSILHANVCVGYDKRDNTCTPIYFRQGVA